MDSKQKANLAAHFALEKKAEDVVILDMRKICNFCNYFVICSGSSSRRVSAIADGIVDNFRKRGIKCQHIEGEVDALWILLDYSDTVVHILDKERRAFYDLEHLWSDAKRIKISKVVK